MAICRTDWSRAGDKKMEGEKRVGYFREAARVKLKTADLLSTVVIPEVVWAPYGVDYEARGDL